MLNVLVALKIAAYQWTDCKVRIQYDNMAVVEVLVSGKTKDKVLATYARNIWLLSSLYNITLQVDHIPGRYNTVADLSLSSTKYLISNSVNIYVMLIGYKQILISHV